VSAFRVSRVALSHVLHPSFFALGGGSHLPLFAGGIPYLPLPPARCPGSLYNLFRSLESFVDSYVTVLMSDLSLVGQ